MDGLKKRYSLLDQGFGEGQEQVAEFLDEQGSFPISYIKHFLKF